LPVLDCESYQSSLKSISDVYAASATDVTKFLLGIDLDREYHWEYETKSSDWYLVELFQSRFGAPIQAWDTVCWFHLTRVPPSTNFEEGILPLHLALDKLWDAIVAIPRSTQTRANLEYLRNTGVPDHLYMTKAQYRVQPGPYAMLVRETAFHSKAMGNHDYLKLPEIIEDICNGYERQYHESIHEEITEGLRKCIVKFEVPDKESSKLVAPALFYCWCKAHNWELSVYANTCYDARGEAIPHSAIRKIEFP
jgi:hypothetical protein